LKAEFIYQPTSGEYEEKIFDLNTVWKSQIWSWTKFADGIKLQKTKTVGGVPTTTDYAGNYVYENNQLQFFNTSEGYVEPDGSGGYNYVYSYTDHLGNVRLNYSDFDGNGTISQSEILKERNFYPFGLEHSGYNNVVNGSESNYKTFQGQEISKELGLNWLSFKYRNYDPAIGRFMSVDPLAEKFPGWSPYNFVMNNPINLIDPDGREPIKPLVGTIQQALSFFRANNITTVRGIDDFFKNPTDANGNRLGAGDYVRYVYTENNGWIDLRHYFGSAIRGELPMDALELSQCAAGYGSCYSYEDLPSNDFGGNAPLTDEVIEMQYSPMEKGVVPKKKEVFKTGESLLDAVENHFTGAGATNPESAPNYNNLPYRERPKAPNSTDKEINTGKYVPQNRSEKPYDLSKFPKPSEEYLKPKQ
jgi:RHS repeat-associated protein